MKNAIFILIFCIIIVTPSTGQMLWQDVDFVKSFQSKIDKTEPATLSLTIPKNKPSSYFINGAIGADITYLFYTRDDIKFIKLIPFLEYNRNTLVDKLQHQLQSGFAFEWLIDNNSRFLPMIFSDAKYASDYEKNIESFQSTLLFSPGFTGFNSNFRYFYIPDNLVGLGSNSFFQFEYVPYIGMETENRFKTIEESLKGNIYRLVGKLQSNFYFFPKRENGRYAFHYIVMSLDYQYRSEISNSTSSKLENNSFLQLGLNYTIYKDNNIDAKIGFDYSNGANPTKAFENQNFYGISLKVKM